MEHRKLREKLKDKSGLIVYVELTGGPGFNLGPIEKFLNAYKAANSLAGPDGLDFVRKSIIPDGFDFAGVTLPQNPAGLANIKPADVLSQLTSKNLTGNLEFIPHVTCKDHNVSGILSLLAGYRNIGIETILVMTGDKPMEAKSVFELDSIGLLQLIRDMNNESYIKASPGSLDKSHQFFPGAAVSPFKYTEASQMQQYYKMEKKIACGARFFITQVGWDWRKSLELFRYLDENNPDVPIIGNVYLLSSVTPAPRLMHDDKLPGCFVSDQLLAKVYSESVDDHIERAAQQVAMYNTLGAAGVDIAGVRDFEVFIRILKRAADIGTDWERFKDNLHWPPKNGFYLYDQAGRKTHLSKSRKRLKQRLFNLSHRAILNPDYKGFYVFKNVMAVLGADKGKGAIYKLFNAFEKSFKYLAFDCEECGDCFLPENFGLCTIGGCEKAMGNAPCGDATVDGRCGNNLELVCIGELIYNAAAAEKGGIERLRAIINKPRNHSLEHSSSILNFLFGKDHTMKNQLITIGESIHASIPKTGEIMKQLSELGPNAYVEPSGPLNYIKALIESQVSEGADYIAVNLDALCEDNPQLAIDMMVEYVELVRKWGNGVPICIDSGNDDILIAGLKEWYNTHNENPKSLKKPLINSVKVYTTEKILPLKRDFDFAFIGLLESNEAPTGPGGSCSVDEMYSLAKQIFEKAVGEYGFKNAEIFFDSTVFPLAIDMPMEPGVPGYTHRTFETINKIKSDPKMKGVHCSLGISNCTRDLPGRKVGLCRAYLAKAIEYGLDAAIVNVAHRYGQVPPDAELLQFVDAYAKMDGSAERLNLAVELMGKFCRESRKPS
jgi:methylenetetrahydrofolate reductase (NADPH)